jgi:hypothetical protein
MSSGGWLLALRRYLAVTVLGNLLWEPAQLPLYTIWDTGTVREKAFAVMHCTGGDILIALATWSFAVIIAGHPLWPTQAFRRVALLTIVAGLAYTGFSEWLNTAVRQSWGYSDLMPIIPGLRLGLSPVLQWLVIPSLALWTAQGAVLSDGRQASRAAQRRCTAVLRSLNLAIGFVRGSAFQIAANCAFDIALASSSVADRNRNSSPEAAPGTEA